jgi:hypothetical protein
MAANSICRIAWHLQRRRTLRAMYRGVQPRAAEFGNFQVTPSLFALRPVLRRCYTVRVRHALPPVLRVRAPFQLLPSIMGLIDDLSRGTSEKERTIGRFGADVDTLIVRRHLTDERCFLRPLTDSGRVRRNDAIRQSITCAALDRVLTPTLIRPTCRSSCHPPR